ncbi:hypothetical protein EVJ58_g1221 [Rhodofomes roseus]|uniref:RNA 3'-terminal phosphate cyclase insert domain-containing protein n=1 Tax=Rhodofomes roseus TaxID=34475 RepID=A0A4Y9Z0B2_9APHY|nr:hypothetical protein EVJ58_g1221 [Rhodofomes roseus]
MRNSAAAALQNGGIDPDIIHIEAIREESRDAVGSGSGIVLWAETDGGCVLGGSAIGVKGKKPAKVGEEAAHELLRNLAHGGCVDEYMQVRFMIVCVFPASEGHVGPDDHLSGPGQGSVVREDGPSNSAHKNRDLGRGTADEMRWYWIHEINANNDIMKLAQSEMFDDK